MAETHRCLECGAPLAADVAQGLCPKCLLKAGLGARTQSGAGETAASPAGGPAGSPARPAVPLPDAGQTFGAYRLVRLLGKGGMGAVYEAEHLESGRRVALKVLSHSLDSPQARARFLREGRLAASINHPNSVYIYGTEEVEDTPVIAMELVAGGTLEDRVRQKGPLPVGEAVDTILQIIEGLEAAQTVGVLHRDVKPSNCFVERDGTAKVGDFGLSISTKGRIEANLTTSGTFLGTPAFSSPEQLRGDELDVRSDIYAVGITLYYLLTGKTPFAGDNVVRFIATVLESPAESPAKFCPALPKGLCRAVLRCLEKQPAQRFRNYAELREALLPFASAAPTPATLGLRFLAAAVDLAAWSVLWMPLSISLMGHTQTLGIPTASPTFLSFMAASLALWVLYYAVTEGLWGASFGKWVCRLRVVGPSRSVAGVPRALLRAAAYVVFPIFPLWVYFGFDPERMATVDPKALSAHQLASLSYYVLLALMFVTARRRNGFAGLHDLASGTRVIRKAAYEARPLLAPEDHAPPVAEATPTIGPYYVLQTLDTSPAGELVLGYDARLLRKVWIRRLPDGVPPVAAGLRAVGRVGRLRWLAGKRAANENWDAYEAAPGRPLLSLLGDRQPWRSVRYWLLDLAEELQAGLKDGSVPAAVGLDRIWITASGRAKLLDFPAPGIPAGGAAPRAIALADFAAARPVLNQAAIAALEGRVLDAEAARGRTVAAPLPVHARTFLSSLASVQGFEPLIGELKALLQKVASVSRLRRFGLVAGCAALPILAGVGLFFGSFMLKQMAQSQPEVEPLRLCLMRIAMMGTPPLNDKDKRDREAIEVYIAGHFRKTISDPATWSNFYAKSVIPEGWRKTGEQIVATRPNPSQEELAEAAAVVKPLLDEMSSFGMPFPPLMPVFVALVWGELVAFLSLACAILLRGGLLLRLFGVAIVRRDGSRASRLRVFWRSLVTWSPLIALPIPVGWLVSVVMPSIRADVLIGITGCLVFALVIPLVIWSALLPERGLQDRLAGTYLVPR